MFFCRFRFFHTSATYRMRWAEVSAALRPFYLKVHPDMFMNFPNARITNEDSLKDLNSYLEALTKTQTPQNRKLDFFIKREGSSQLTRLTVDLRGRGLVDTLKHILRLVDLPIDKITGTSYDRESSSFKEDQYGYQREGDPYWNLHEDEFSRAPDVSKKMSLNKFLEENVDAALERSRLAQPMYEETHRVEAQVLSALGLKQVVWDCGWGIAHYRAGLLALLNLHEHHSDVRGILENRTLIFGQWTGVSLEGNIILSSAEVRHHWLRFLREVDKQFKFVDWVPHSEKQLTDVLRGIRISHERLHGRTLAYKYLVQVDKLTKTLHRWLWLNKFPAAIPDDLSTFSLIVENDAGPLMVSHSGELIVPASCPAQLFVDFLESSLPLAEKAMARHAVDILEEEELHAQVMWKLGLRELSKDETISSFRMVKCLTALLEASDELSTSLQDCHIRVSNCYSVLQDGILCIPSDLDS
ncbi:T-cell activation inhibitor, mitochondrial [Galendromus occidentalis]|uniref:T-cell activation inhibitor, mitochondrial n=1 Tax=Galendromus occidentalis TaxID=34638 RepID=A0AAJ6QRL8_9ACAR|nr:T-cell activation inhibitor, mitochondrial [Galendromus occidentalis]